MAPSRHSHNLPMWPGRSLYTHMEIGHGFRLIDLAESLTNIMNIHDSDHLAWDLFYPMEEEDVS